jgi:hypothetical protein
VPAASLVEMSERVCVFQLRRAGLLAVGTAACIEAGDGGHRGSHLAVREPGKVEIDGQPIRLVSHPMCNASVVVCPACDCQSNMPRAVRI